MKSNSFFSKKETPLTQVLDNAWEIYKQEKEDDVNVVNVMARDFLMYALDISDSWEESKQKAILEKLMDEREEGKKLHPEFIPGKLPFFFKLNKIVNEDWLRKAIKKNKIPEVNEEDKKGDEAKGMSYFNPSERNQYRVLIKNGDFTQQGELIDTKKLVSHRKMGYGALVITLLGELYIFTHLGEKNLVAHSSMCEGQPVLGAGEIKIKIIKKDEFKKISKLKAINIYSGHYQPKLYHLYYMLLYFQSLGVDISRTNLYTMHSPNRAGLNMEEKLVGIPKLEIHYHQEEKKFDYKSSDDFARFYKFKANLFLEALKEHLINSAQKIIDLIPHHEENSWTLFFKAKEALVFSVRGKENPIMHSEVEMNKFKEKFLEIKREINEVKDFITFEERRKKFKKILAEWKEISALFKGEQEILGNNSDEYVTLNNLKKTW